MFFNESYDFDQDTMWLALKEELDKKKRRPAFIWIFFGGLMLLSSVVYFAYGWMHHHSNGIEKEVTDEIIVTANESANAATSEISTENNLADKSSLAKEYTVQKTKGFENEKLNTYETNNKKHLTQVGRAKNKNHRINPEISSEINSSSHTLANEMITSVVNAYEPIVLQETSSAIGQEQKLVNSPAETINNALNNSINQNSAISAADYIPSLDQQLFDRRDYPFTLTKMEATKDWSRCEVGNPWSFAAELYGGYAFPLVNNSLNGRGDAMYLADWENAHSPVGGFQGGIQLIGRSPNGFEVGLGAEYQRVVEKLESEVTFFQTLRILDPMAYFYRDSIGQIVWVEDTVTVYQTTTEKRTSELRHSMINIPLRVGYVMDFDGWRLGGHVGGVIHLNNKFDGLILQPNGNYLELNEDNFDSVYKKDVSFSALVDLHLGRQIGDHSEVFIQPSFRYRPTSWTQDSHQINTKIQLAQLSAGLRYYFD